MDEPTSFLDREYLGCAHRQCKPNEKISEHYKKMFESHLSTGATEKLPGWQKLNAKTVAWSYDMEGHAQKCFESSCELANKNYTSSRRRSNIHSGKDGGCSQIGQHLCQTIKIRWFLMHEICSDTHLWDSYGKDRSKKFFWDLDGKKYRIGNVCLLNENKNDSFRYTCMIFTWL